MVISSDFEIFTLFFLQKFFIHSLPFLVWIFLGFFCSGKINLLYPMFPIILFQTVYDAFYVATYNVFFSSLPVLALGVFDQDVSADHSMSKPHL
jgi:phospholipid-translocating ATPase